MNLFGLMETSGSAMQAERMRAEVVAANMANAETTRTESGGPYRRQHVVFAANQGDAEFLSALTSATRSIQTQDGGISLVRPGSLAQGSVAAAYILRRWWRTARRRSSATIPGILMRVRMGTWRIPILIPSQRWWT